MSDIVSCDIDDLGPCASGLSAIKAEVDKAADAGSTAASFTGEAFGILGAFVSPPANALQQIVVQLIRASSRSVAKLAQDVRDAQSAYSGAEDRTCGAFEEILP